MEHWDLTYQASRTHRELRLAQAERRAAWLLKRPTPPEPVVEQACLFCRRPDNHTGRPAGLLEAA